MSSWQGANLRRQPQRSTTGESSNKRRKTSGSMRPSETVEAALNRLQKAYGTAMECVGAWHKADAALGRRERSSSNNDNDSNKTLDPLWAVGRAARQTLEGSILRDALVRPHAPAWSFQDAAVAEAAAGGSTTPYHHSPTTAVQLRSAGHRATVKQLAYLSLVNYGDLLLQGLPPFSTTTTTTTNDSAAPATILDRGVVPSLKSFLREANDDSTTAAASCSCWTIEPKTNLKKIEEDRIADNMMDVEEEGAPVAPLVEEEPEQQTVRYALVAYLDATALDGSDPTLWLKLACAARRLGRLLSSADGNDFVTSPCFWKHRRLEQHALERAVAALPPSQPPNRTAVRALDEWHREAERVTEYPPTAPEQPMTEQPTVEESLVLVLPRYSWSTLGRMLLRVCREGSSYSNNTRSGYATTNVEISTTTTTTTTGYTLSSVSPNVQVQLSPILVLPTTVLATVCSFLEPRQMGCFEITCRAMAASIISARAVLDNDLDASRRSLRRQRQAAEQAAAREEEEEAKRSEGEGGASVPRPPASGPPARSHSRGSSVEGDTSERSTTATTKRVSKRVQSQIITSGKRSERSFRRNSTEYCLLAATLGCTANDDEHYRSVLRKAQDEEAAKNDRRADAALLKQAAVERVSSAKEVALERLSDSSLHNFVKRVSSRRAISPLACLFDFVAHTSMHVSDVFCSDPGGSLVMSTCLLDCVDLMARRTSLFRENLTSCWSIVKHKVPKDSGLDRVGLFAIDLLHAELRLKKCDDQELVNFCFESDGSLVTSMVPDLLSLVEEIDQDAASIDNQAVWRELKARCSWLAANFYLWRGRLSNNLGESREAEEEGLYFIEATRNYLQGLSGSVAIPHLGSPSRRGQHWQELSVASLAAYADEIQASSIVLLAQEQFLEATAKFAGSDNGRLLEKEDRDALFSIGDSLMKRYDTAVDSPHAKHAELIDDFIAAYGEKLLSTFDERRNANAADGESLLSWFSGLVCAEEVKTIRSLLRVSNPCILTILTSCLKTKDGQSTRVLELLVRLVLCLVNLSERVSARIDQQHGKKKRTEPSGGFSDSESDDGSISGEEGLDEDEGKPAMSADATRLHQYATLMQLVLAKIRDLYQRGLTEGEKHTLAKSEEVTSLLSHTLTFSAGWFQCSTPATFDDRSKGDDLGIFLEVQAIFRSLTSSVDESQAHDLTRSYLRGLIHITVTQRRILSTFSRLKPCAKGRAKRLEITRRRADLVATVCCDAGLLLSTFPVRFSSSGEIKRSVLFDDTNSGISLDSALVLFSETLSWLWKASSASQHSDVGTHLGSYLDAFGRARLRVPVAVAIVGLCGSASTTGRSSAGEHGRHRTNEPSGDDQVSLFEFYDSDASAIEWLSSEEQDGGGEGLDMGNLDERRKNEELLRVIMQAVHCVCGVFGEIDDKEAAGFSHVKDYVTSNGPILPLIVARVLNRFSYHLLVEFAEAGSGAEAKWSDYPFGTRTIGLLLDSMLCKAYKCLHGFTLSSSGTDSKESSHISAVAASPNSSDCFAPENEEAAVMLYRCVMRAYSQGRRSPPKIALDVILAALPEVEESAKARTIREFLFSNDTEDINVSRLASLVLRPTTWEASFENVEGFGWIEGSADGEEDLQNDVLVVRRGLARLISQGPLPTYQDTGNDNETRSSSALTEEELSRKFLATIEDLCFGKTNDCDGWFKAFQCLMTKADLIADRLGLSKGFARCRNFTVSERQGIPEASLDIVELVASQEREARLNEEGWIQCLGPDLSIFVFHNWSSFSSLKVCSEKVGETYDELLKKAEDDVEDQESHFGARVWQEINNLFVKNDFVGWQQAWGGLFVSSLRKAAHRCLSIALYLSYKTTNDLLISEITESLGTSLYSELMGSQVYGYPMQEMSPMRKREIAEAALACFERAVEVVKAAVDDASDDGRITWDLHFMIGKCREKIASTYEREAFPLNEGSGEERLVRGYERNMSLALQAYAVSLSQAKEAEEAGDLPTEQNGGSSHGAVEVVYRLHASRLKCLIAAVDRKEDERQDAELEALRLTECHWFADSGEEKTGASVRERVWKVLVDVVNALARCRLDNNYFHRSVYRHAQALMWAPVLFDPVEGRAKRSLGTVSATWACQIRGLNYATHAASSAVSTMSALFEKKRSQLVAVWVTADGTSSAFQTINNTVRKYDSLRGKYIAAYVDGLSLCARRKELETFLRWTSTTARDLPSYFAASALTEGGKPQRSHMHDSLMLKGRSLAPHFFLTTVKRQANSGLANVILNDLKEKVNPDQKFLESQLKLAYACFLRLNCDPKGLSKSNAWKYHRQNGAKDVVEALTTAFLKVVKDQPLSGALSDWSGESQLTTTLQMALQKCKEMFPSVSGKFFISKKQVAPKKTAPEASSSPAPVKQTVEQSFVVGVPEGMAAGQTFMASIQVGKTLKKVRLTVPTDNASSLRFNLQVPVDEALAGGNEQAASQQSRGEEQVL